MPNKTRGVQKAHRTPSSNERAGNTTAALQHPQERLRQTGIENRSKTDRTTGQVFSLQCTHTINRLERPLSRQPKHTPSSSNT